jgi:hypothetical protein
MAESNNAGPGCGCVALLLVAAFAVGHMVGTDAGYEALLALGAANVLYARLP